MSLESYSRNGWIRKHASSPREIADLFAIADRDIQQSETPGLGPEWRFDIAYNSALQSATAALAAAGFRAERANKHLRTIECLEFTVGLDKSKVRLFDKFRRKRHVAVYEQVGAISSREADEMIEMAKKLRQRVETRIRSDYPQLLSSQAIKE
jgi:hypothetical protein